ncbi:MAG: hypothetical protein COB02_08790 [Candidatus Cloacimonadota bacterium]|nr:MAG: hypothetical protein COB02_08790 [Candidatus Cloacimonadota bacterium]
MKSDQDIERLLRGETPGAVELENFQKIRDFLRSNPGSAVDEIALGTGVDERIILRLINSGKLLKR